MSPNPLVSVLICAYNADKYITECLDSVISQTYKNIEVILINDGSTDNTLNIINHYSSQFPNITVYDNGQNIGFINSLNKGLELVTGKYIARIDADDFAEPEWIALLVNELEQRGELSAIGAYIKILSPKNNGSVLEEYFQDGEVWVKPEKHEDIKRYMMFGNPMHHNSMLIRTDIIKEFNLKFDLNQIHAEDYKFWLELSRVGKLANYPKPLVTYRFHNTQTSSLHTKTQVAIAKKIRREAITYYFNDLGININVKDKIKHSDLVNILNSEKLKTLDYLTLNKILYEFYLSLDSYNIFELFNDIIKNKTYRRIFSIKQHIKIAKKFLRPWKYSPPL